MKRFAVLILVLLLGSLACGQVIEKIEIQSTTAVTAEYDSSTGQLDWSDGGFSYIVTDSSAYTFDGADVSFSWSLYQDESSGGNARAWFDLESAWTINLYDNDYYSGSSPVVTIQGGAESSGW
jgi:hypothetical protein